MALTYRILHFKNRSHLLHFSGLSKIPFLISVSTSSCPAPFYPPSRLQITRPSLETQFPVCLSLLMKNEVGFILEKPMCLPVYSQPDESLFSYTLIITQTRSIFQQCTAGLLQNHRVTSTINCNLLLHLRISVLVGFRYCLKIAYNLFRLRFYVYK